MSLEPSLVSSFDYDLPPELIAQVPAEPRGASRLLFLERNSGRIVESTVARLPALLVPGDLLVVNDTRVFPAHLLGRRVPSGGAVECLLLERLDDERWDALVHPGQKLRPGARVVFERDGRAMDGEILDQRFFGRRTIRLRPREGTIEESIDAVGHVPLPPYIRRADEGADRERYQTMFARVRGSVAAPTAGLHFTPAILTALASRGVEHVALTLHVGYGTFKPVREAEVERHTVDPERFAIGEEAASRINARRQEGGRIIAVGTTTTRALEMAASLGGGRVRPGEGLATNFIRPGYAFQVVNGLFTNFHLPRSSLLMLVCAFGGRERVLAAYRYAVEHKFRFYSYGDAMLIL